MPHRVIIGNLQKKIYYPFYLLEGAEPYFIDKISDYFQNHFFEDEGLRDFNQQVVYGRDVRMEEIVSMAKEYPMMSDHRLLIVREAQDIPKSPGQKEADYFSVLTQYLQQPQMQTLLVFCYKYKTVDKRSAFFKAVNKVGCVFEAPTIYEEQLPNYIKMMAQERRLQIDDQSALLMASHIGVDLSRIEKEMDKFTNLLPPDGKIQPAMIEEQVGISREYNGYELANALWERNEQKVFDILSFFSKNPKNYPVMKILPIVYGAFQKILQYHYAVDKQNLKALGVFWKSEAIFRSAVRYYSLPVTIRIIRMLKEYDLKSKGYEGCSTEGTELLEELSFRIMHALV
ncbi:MAG: DNA polymerase III subunit delta [Bacteroidales bacterium]|nr:DNA polymerase III subunit delta [Bacteroidales bacterium]